MRQQILFITCLTSSMFVFPVSVLANGLSDLQSALQREQGQTPIKGVLEAKVRRIQGGGKDADEQQGEVSLFLEETTDGMRLRYAAETLSRLDSENGARVRDAKAKTPTLLAVDMVGYRDIRAVTGAGQALARLLQRSTLISEKEEAWNGKPARLLHFSMGMPSLSERERQYVKKYTGTLDVWIGPDGTPLASRSRQTFGGRAFLVVTFEQNYDEDCTYALIGDRLVATHRETNNSGSGGGETGEGHTVIRLKLEEHVSDGYAAR